MSSEGEKARTSGEVSRPEPTLPTVNPAAERAEPPKPAFHPAVYVTVWITLSSSVILFNKHILDYAQFRFPIILTTWHLAFATFMTQILARTTTLLDGRKTVKMTGRVYLRAIVPIGLFFSLSLICGNVTYLYLSVAFIQMLKATTPVAVLFATWGMGMAPVNYKVLMNVSLIVIGVIIASFGEIKFVLTGFLFQIGGIIFEATRLVMVQRLLSSAEYKMDPLVSLYYFAPVCAVMNGVTALFMEVPYVTMDHVYRVGVWTLLLNAVIAFLLNVSVVFLIGKTSSLVMTLCGVLKDILLVVASMMIWQTPVTGTQFFGYSIALIGLVYYKLGGDKIKEYTGQANRAWAEYGANHPAKRKSIIIGAIVLIFFLLAGSMAPSYAGGSVDRVKGLLGGATAGNA
ncbi:triose-phosphate transporter family-domain-containing protein [Aspergillus pseudonomiae]|uniref:Triose-phosphate transporter family-domain-containing protein n=1 Tax=Aspergillus pseudonomiae TaxID=1506151 RepID=A0A5N7DET1_9EURO|nr:triose-phosphate transporter family-domain-containing protein [Aspergillus pseudonomiae]KAB8259197.1 triose-phosphate transporter family-domain-containing protein [Aspergillus pseudonomiae]KAE8404695.1 triose-phosphate transporter family-domain-containing protein [Aspergillus pseudonomiae]